MLNPKVSVIIPTCNRAELLGRAINSGLNQEYQDLEIVVVDDSSGNDSENIIKGFPRRCIRYSKRKQKGGVASARNLGVKLSTGKYIAFLDDDDEWLPNKLTRQISLLSQTDNSVGVIHSNGFVDKGSGLILYHKEDISNQSPQKLLEYDFVINSTSVIRRDCFDVVGYFDEQMPYAEDWDFFFRVSKKYRFIYLHEPTVILHFKNINSDRISQNLRSVVRGEEIFVAKHWKEYEYYRVTRARARKLYYIGLSLNVLAERRAANWCFLKSSFVYPPNFLPLLILCFYNFEDSTVNKKSDFANLLRRLAKQRLLVRALG